MVVLKPFFDKETAFFDLPLRLSSRIMILTGVLSLVLVFLFPLWNLTFYSNQYQDGLQLNIHAQHLEGGKSATRNDLYEINELNHYIGMRPLLESEFSEFTWMPFVIGALGLLALRAMVIGKMGSLVDVLVLFVYFGLYSMWSFYHRLYLYGHTLSPQAAIKVPGFTPPMFGEKVIANFTVYSYPDIGSYALVAFGVFLALAIFFSRKHA